MDGSEIPEQTIDETTDYLDYEEMKKANTGYQISPRLVSKTHSGPWCARRGHAWHCTSTQIFEGVLKPIQSYQKAIQAKHQLVSILKSLRESKIDLNKSLGCIRFEY